LYLGRCMPCLPGPKETFYHTCVSGMPAAALCTSCWKKRKPVPGTVLQVLLPGLSPAGHCSGAIKQVGIRTTTGSLPGLLRLSKYSLSSSDPHLPQWVLFSRSSINSNE
jgi:hypothetical protein